MERKRRWVARLEKFGRDSAAVAHQNTGLGGRPLFVTATEF